MRLWACGGIFGLLFWDLAGLILCFVFPMFAAVMVLKFLFWHVYGL